MGNAAYGEPFQRFGGSGAAAVASADHHAAAVLPIIHSIQAAARYRRAAAWRGY
jgi:hypothetical protein